MATMKQIDANRRNAQKSTGPKTPEGKAKTRFNAVKHGFCSVHNCLPHEDPEEHKTVLEMHSNSWEPANNQEAFLIDLLASNFMKMQRANRYEASMTDGYLVTTKANGGANTAPAGNDDLGVAMCMANKSMETAWRLLERYEKRATSGYFKALEMLRKLQNDRKNEPIRQMRAHREQQAYLKRTKAAPKQNASAMFATKMGSFGQNSSEAKTPSAAPVSPGKKDALAS